MKKLIISPNPKKNFIEELYKEFELLKKELKMNKKSKEQEKIFNDIQKMQNDIMKLSSYMQNDISLMLGDGQINRRGIQKSIIDMDKDFDEFISKLNELREQSRKILWILLSRRIIKKNKDYGNYY